MPLSNELQELREILRQDINNAIKTQERSFAHQLNDLVKKVSDEFGVTNSALETLAKEQKEVNEEFASKFRKIEGLYKKKDGEDLLPAERLGSLMTQQKKLMKQLKKVKKTKDAQKIGYKATDKLAKILDLEGPTEDYVHLTKGKLWMIGLASGAAVGAAVYGGMKLAEGRKHKKSGYTKDDYQNWLENGQRTLLLSGGRSSAGALGSGSAGNASGWNHSDWNKPLALTSGSTTQS